jgi:hypothetical protein
MPYLLGESNEQMVHSLGFLVAQQASSMVLQASICQAIRRPATVLIGKLVEKLHSGRRPGFPDALPGRACHGALERRKVSGASCEQQLGGVARVV